MELLYHPNAIGQHTDGAKTATLLHHSATATKVITLVPCTPTMMILFITLSMVMTAQYSSGRQIQTFAPRHQLVSCEYESN